MLTTLTAIQGKDCLVQKFRNSSVMLEAPHYRPKVCPHSPGLATSQLTNQLYFTSNGPRPELSGQEEVFPPPDNQSKMKRSCENAEHVGGSTCPLHNPMRRTHLLKDSSLPMLGSISVMNSVVGAHNTTEAPDLPPSRSMIMKPPFTKSTCHSNPLRVQYARRHNQGHCRDFLTTLRCVLFRRLIST
jgi:hypothetical protein